MRHIIAWVLLKLDAVLWPARLCDVAPWRRRWADRCYDAARWVRG